MRVTKIVAALGVVGALLLTTTACGTHTASTAADQVGLHYKGGPFSNKAYGDYIPASTKKWYGPGDTEYLYPNNQRTFDATGGKDAESQPITSVSRDQAEVATPVSVTFRLKIDEKSLRKFHENVGNRYKAYMKDDQSSEGWLTMLNFYLGQALNTTLDRMVQNYNWRDLYSKPEVRTALQQQIDTELPQLVDQQMGGEYFTNYQALVQQPVPTNQALKDSLAAQQAAVTAASTAKAKADADTAAANAQLALQRAEANKKRADIAGYGSVDAYLKAQAIEKGINPYQPTYVVPQPAK